MKVPPGYTEKQVLEIIDQTVNVLARSFVFGYFDVDDIKQYGRIFALELLEKDTYDPSLPLQNYIHTHVRNRLCNLKRDKYRRTDAPCKRCHNGSYCTGTRSPCEKYRLWDERNSRKANLMRPLDLQEEKVGNDCVTEKAERNELLRIIDENLPVELRGAYLKIRAGVSVSKSQREQVEQAIRGILCRPHANADD